MVKLNKKPKEEERKSRVFSKPNSTKRRKIPYSRVEGDVKETLIQNGLLRLLHPMTKLAMKTIRKSSKLTIDYRKEEFWENWPQDKKL